MTCPLPDGFTARSATTDDASVVAELWNDRIEATRNERPSTPERVLQRWNHHKFDVSTDSRLVFAPNGALIGYAHIRDVKDPPVDVFAGLSVHPEYDDARWLWDDVFTWMEREAHRVIDRAPAEARIVLLAGSSDEDRTEQRELESYGFSHDRTFYQMVIDFADASAAEPEWPAGIEVRSFVPGVDDEALVRATQEAFSDHYGHIRQPLEAELAELRHWMAEDDFEADLWFLACEGEEIVGFCTCYAETPGDTDRGLVDVFGVRPARRRCGIGRALLLHAFREFSHRGKRGVVLTVDTQNKSGAPELYKLVGMRPHRANHTYVKELRPGTDLVTK